MCQKASGDNGSNFESAHFRRKWRMLYKPTTVCVNTFILQKYHMHSRRCCIDNALFSHILTRDS